MAEKYLEIAQDIRHNILTGKLKPRQQLPTRNDLVLQYNTSKATMQKTINALLREGFIHTGNKTGTVVADAPPNLYSIAIVFPIHENEPDYTDTLWTGIMRQQTYLEEHFGRHFVFVHFYSSNIEHEEFQGIIRDAESLRLAGIIFTDPPTPNGIAAMRHLNIPRVVLSDRDFYSLNRVGVNYDMFFTLAMEYLSQCGRSRLSVIVNTEMPPDYIVSSRQLAADRGVAMPPELEFCIGLGDYSTHWARNLIRLLFKLPPEMRPDGLIIGNENLLDPILNALRGENIEPGREIDIAVHTNFPTRRLNPGKIKRIGFDVRDIISGCIETLEESSPGNIPVRPKMIRAVCEDEVDGQEHR